MTAATEIEAINPELATFEFEDGFEVKVSRLKTIQLLKLLRILTRGAGSVLEDFGGSLLSGDEEEIGGKLIGLLIFAIPEAEDETMEFLRSMVEPTQKVPGNGRAVKEQNLLLEAQVDEVLINPPLGDTIGLISRIIENEKSEMARLGKQLGSILGTTTMATANSTPPTLKDQKSETSVSEKKSSAKSSTKTSKDSTQIVSLEDLPVPST